MNRLPAVFFQFLLLAIATTSCCNSELIRNVHFSPQALAINPYTGTDEIHFRSLQGDSLVLTGDYRTSESYEHYPYAKEGTDCKGDYVEMEKNITQLTSTSYEWRFKISLDFYYYPSYDSAAPYIRFESNNLSDSSYDNETSRGAFFWTDTIYDRGMFLNNYYDYHPEVSIGPNSYENIYEFFLIQAYSLHNDWVDTLYYSIQTGIVGFKTHLGETWYLVTH
jgi:hypothetical protein